MYVPPIIIDEIEDIRFEENILTKADAMRKLVEHSRCGREVQRLATLNWSRKRPQKPIKTYKMRKTKNIFKGVL